MSRRQKISKIHDKIMIASEQIVILSDFIQYQAENNIQKEILAQIINEKTRIIAKSNERLGLLLRL